jgi:hypothetical protein
MIVRNEPTDPAHMTPEDRLTDLAVILATGVLRLHRRAAISVSPNPQIPSDSGQNCLDLSARPSPDGSAS